MASPKHDGNKSPPLWGLPEHLSRDLFKGATPVHLRVDEVLFHAGDAGNGCYRVDNGLVKVTKISGPGSERILALLGPGAVVGELSMIDELPRSTSVVAVRPAALSFVSRAAFETFAEKHPELYKYFGRLACTLLQLADTRFDAESWGITDGIHDSEVTDPISRHARHAWSIQSH
jgi:CRP/FNR family cyclic AMP-dependent transcriptional regulator